MWESCLAVRRGGVRASRRDGVSLGTHGEIVCSAVRAAGLWELHQTGRFFRASGKAWQFSWERNGVPQGSSRFQALASSRCPACALLSVCHQIPHKVGKYQHLRRVVRKTFGCLQRNRQGAALGHRARPGEALPRTGVLAAPPVGFPGNPSWPQFNPQLLRGQDPGEGS